ncbi:MAG: hypothetical protein ABI467_08805 [Kofleriaceae bacterium]
MASRFAVEGNRLTIDQTRRGARIILTIAVLGLILGAVPLLVPHAPKPIHTTCSHATGACTIDYGHHDHAVPLASISGADLRAGQLVLVHGPSVVYHVCRAPVGAPMLPRLAAFFADDHAAAVAFDCDSLATGVPPAGIVAGLLGSLLLIGMIGIFVVESHVVIDRDAGTIAMRGSRWPFWRWSLERPLSEIRGVMMRRIYSGRGQSLRPVYIVFSDDSVRFAWSPAAYMLVAHLDRVAQLRAFLGLPPHADT